MFQKSQWIKDECLMKSWLRLKYLILSFSLKYEHFAYHCFGEVLTKIMGIMIRDKTRTVLTLVSAELSHLEDQMINDENGRVPTPLMTFQEFYAHPQKVVL